MINQETFEFLGDQLLENAVKEYKQTSQYELLREKLSRMDADCNCMFTETEKDFTEECFALLLDVSGREEQYLYRRGMLDCVSILKYLGVLV